MAIYRGPGGAGDATNDATSQAILAAESAQQAAASAAASAASASQAATSATNSASSATASANSATAAANSANSASTSATNAANSATAAQTAQTAAELAETNAETAEANAETAEANAAASAALAQDWATKTSGPVAGGEYSSKYNAQLAATSATNAANSATSASTSASAASTSATNAASSATAAASSASAASTSETNAANSATAAAGSATSAASSASTATTQSSNAASSATAAATSASNAATSETNAANSASAAATSATNASNSASSASTSATNASNSASAAATSATNAAASAIDAQSSEDAAAAYASSINPANFLAKANNLSDLSNTSTARTNLGLGTAATMMGPTSTIVGTTDTQTLTNKTLTSPIIDGTGVTFNDGSSQQTAATGFGFKNRIINGAMMIDQRNAGAQMSGSIAGSYTLDRWIYDATQNSKVTIQQNAGSVTPPVGFSNYLGVTSTSAYTVGSGDLFNIAQYIEGFNTSDLNWGTANAKTVTLSFQVYSSLTGTFGGALQNNARTQSYPFTYSIPVANTWTSISVTIAGSTTGTWLTTNGRGLSVFLGLGVGSTYSATAGSWQSGDYRGATGATSVVGTNGATFYITGVQLEKGSTATSFDYRPYGTELALCQRYYYVVASGTSSPIGMCSYFSSTNLQGFINFPEMRASPTFANTSGSNYYRAQVGGVGTDDFNSLAMDRYTPRTLQWYNVTEVNGTAGYAGVVYGITASSYIALQAEL